LFYVLLYSLVADLFLNEIIYSLSKNEFLGLRLFTFVEYSLISLFLYSIITSKKFKKAIVILSVLFFAFSIYDMLQSRSITFDSIPTGIECILILSYSIFYLFEKINNPNTLFLYATSEFWIITAFIIYFSGTFFLFIYSQSYYQNPDFQVTYSIVVGSFTILKNLMLSIAFIIKPSKSNPPIILPRKTSY
jgi:hypothetical protein